MARKEMPRGPWRLKCTLCGKVYSTEHYKEGDPCLCVTGKLKLMVEKTEEKHSILGASSSKRWMACPGSVKLCEGIPATTSKYAEEGTAAHALGEHCLNKKVMDVGQYFGSAVPGRADEVTEEMVNAVQVYVSTVLNDLNNTKKAKLVTEHKFDLEHVRKGMFGTADAAVFDKKLIRVYDYKHGAGVFVPVEENTQGMYYALGAVHELAPKAKEVEMVIVQPRCTIGEPVRRWRISVKDLYAWRDNELIPAVERAMGPYNDLISGDHCKSTFCPAMAQCPSLANAAYEMAKVDFGSDTTDITLPAPELLTVTEVAKVLDFAGVLSSYAKEVSNFAQKQLESGVIVPGYKLVAKKSNRAWLAEAEEALKDEYGDDAYEQADPKLKSPAQIDKLGKEAKTFSKGLWHNPEAGVTIAASTDKRPEAARPAAVDFLADDELFN